MSEEAFPRERSVGDSSRYSRRVRRTMVKTTTINEVVEAELEDLKPRALPKRQRILSPSRAAAVTRDPSNFVDLTTSPQEERQKPAPLAYAKHTTIDLSRADEVHVFAPKKPATKRMDYSVACRSVLDVLPSADPGRVRELLNQNNDNVDAVVSQLLEEPLPNLPVNLIEPIVTTVHRERKATWSYDFMSPNSFFPADLYWTEGEMLLQDEFPFLSKSGAKRILTEQKHYAIAHNGIMVAIQGKELEQGKDLLESQLYRVERAFAGRRLSAAQQKNLTELARGGRNYIVQPRKAKPDVCDPGALVTDAILSEERQFTKQMKDEWLAMAKLHVQRKLNQARAQQDKSAIECACCFDSFPLDDMCQCRDEGHLFCFECMSNYANNQIFGSGNLGVVDEITKRPAMELKCFSSKCRSGFSREMLEKGLPRQTLEKYDELQSMIVIQAAGLNNMVSCPKCLFQFQMTSNDPNQKKLHCPVDICRFQSCLSCRLEWHDPSISCDEARQREQTSAGLHKVEEAMTMAKIRSCPKCLKSFLKDSGCNKIICTSCSAISCYFCRKEIRKGMGYAHFCQTPHCAHEHCNKCPLWIQNEEQRDNQNVRQAGLEAAAKEATVNSQIVDQLLNDGSNKSQKQMPL